MSLIKDGGQQREVDKKLRLSYITDMAINRKYIGYCVSTRIHDSNGIPTATPLSLGSGNTDILLGILTYVRYVIKQR